MTLGTRNRGGPSTTTTRGVRRGNTKHTIPKTANARRTKTKKSCPRGQNCPFRHEYQHTLEFSHDGANSSSRSVAEKSSSSSSSTVRAFSGRGNSLSQVTASSSRRRVTTQSVAGHRQNSVVSRRQLPSPSTREGPAAAVLPSSSAAATSAPERRRMVADAAMRRVRNAPLSARGRHEVVSGDGVTAPLSSLRRTNLGVASGGRIGDGSYNHGSVQNQSRNGLEIIDLT
mmetsp:Transcript_63881/g.75623  ORF Transcript_63881/g.75623 Transcript_63881/m.75623 type:complete len:229 (+) Transcript_63881:140-826(+)|eukprot:CAMPEP_0172503260 /NCGR_PEP_ID=MMETSP1066-20121228/167682_1 /TAXON_ID=671091 /ORGANISM="Coscinodiscus wailesii, Strain CCMP2513" /LENGTH=228 /DNA_ID=CAMNT_0013278927 /DNA_START=73 /DNA_END=759 /DNA_ORIENTATION=-